MRGLADIAGYDTGLACMNGHPVNHSMNRSPQRSAPFCPKCGEPTLSQCPQCNERLHGFYRVPGVVDLAQRWTPAAYCHNCGQPYPWTQRRSEALAEALDELDELSANEREKLKKSIPDILVETPKSGTAALRFKKAVVKAGTAGGKILTEILTKVAAEAVKKVLGL